MNYRINYGGEFGGASMITIGGVSNSGGKVSYVVGSDLNGDGLTGNDLLFVTDAANMKFDDFTSGTGTSAVTFKAADQAAAWDRYATAHPYLSTRKGKYAERNGGQFPWLSRLDVAFEQDVYMKMANGKKNTLRFRLDVFNFGNMINNAWGVGNVITTDRPLTLSKLDAVTGQPIYKMGTQVVDGKTVLLQDAFVKSKTIDDVYQIQLGVRYIFN
jgi:hypothetical protein